MNGSIDMRVRTVGQSREGETAFENPQAVDI